jgi:hypothetical protein
MLFTKGRSAALLTAVALALLLPAGRAAAQCRGGGQRQMGTQRLGRSLRTQQPQGTPGYQQQLQTLQQQYALLTALQQQQDALAAAALQQRVLAARIARLEKKIEQQQQRLQQQQEKDELVKANALMQKQRKAVLDAFAPKPDTTAPAAPATDGK